MGSKYLRGILHMCAVTAVRHCPDPRVTVEPVYSELAWLTVSGTVRPSAAPQAVEALRDLLRRRNVGANGQEVAWGRQVAAGEWGRAWAATQSATEQVSHELVAGIPPEGQLAWPDRLNEVDADAVGALLKDCVGHEVVSVIGRDLEYPGWEIVDWEAYGRKLLESVER